MVRLLFVSVSVAILSILILYPIDPEVIITPFQHVTNTPQNFTSDWFSRTNHYFRCGEQDGSDENCHGYLYLPNAVSAPRVIVMGCGMGAQKDFAMTKYAEHFAQSGFAVFLFDYRGFGGSEGFPRNFISPFRHLADWRSAVDYVASLDAVVDTTTIALWGTSFAGGHVLSTASYYSQIPSVKIAAVVSQMPFLHGPASSLKNIKERGFFLSSRLILAAIQDQVRSMIGMSPIYIKIIGAKGSLAYMNVSPDQLQTYFARLPKPEQRVGGWRNQAPARALLQIRQYSPLDLLQSGHVNAPVLFVQALKDELCPIELIPLAQDSLHGVTEIHSENCTHFEIYREAYFEQSVQVMSDFFIRHFK